MGLQQPDPSSEEVNVFLKNTAIAGTIITPLAMLLPPRKIDLRFMVLAGAFSMSTNYLAYSYTGQSIYSRFTTRAASLFDMGLPAEAQKTQALLREHRQREAALKQQQLEEKGNQGIKKKVEDVWMGGEGKDWEKKRAEEHQRKFDEGAGLGEIIMDQISEVWSGKWKSSTKKIEEENEPTPQEKK